MTVQHKIILFSVAALIVAVGLWFVPPVAQDLAYHNFADQRGLFGIPNFGDVITNAAYSVIGLLGLYAVRRDQANEDVFRHKYEIVAARLAFIGVFFVGLGSGYYHWAPDNVTLVWDRLPMTLGFMGVFAMILMERISYKFGAALLMPLVIFGLWSVHFWYMSEMAGTGDLRPYIFVQFFPLLAIPALLLMCKPVYTGVRYLWLMIAFYGLAKVLEYFDHQVFDLLQGSVSGHSLKHLASAIGAYYLYRYTSERRYIG